MTTQTPALAYAAPPWQRNAQSKPRSVGIELELGHLSLDETLALVQQSLGGVVRQVSPAQGFVEDTSLGTFGVEVDMLSLKERSYLRPLLPLQADALEAPQPAAARWWPRRLLDLCIAPLVLLLRLCAGARPHGTDHARDRMERALLTRARELELPVLGICRGAQLMNVLEGGTLHHHVEVEERPQLYTALPRREVTLEPASQLRALLGEPRLLVNSLHFHAIAEPGRELRIVARELSGIAQAIEHNARAFWFGVQWHPEYLPQHDVHQRLFQGLVEHARRHRARAPSTCRG